MRLDFTVKFFPLPTPLQCLSPVSTVCPWPLSKTVIVPVTCSNTVSEPHDCSGLVHGCGYVYTRQRERQQERAYTLQVTALEFRSVRKFRSVRERRCKMCLMSSLHAHASDPSLRSYNKPLRSDSFALFLPPCVLCLLDRNVCEQ